MLSLNKINDRLLALTEEYGDILPRFHLAELNYTNKKAQVLMSQEVVGLASQPLREAECDRILAETPEYVSYHTLLPEKMVIDMQLRVYQQISKNLIAINWGESNSQ